MNIKKLPGILIDAVFPPICPICNKIAPSKGRICPDCEKKLPYVEEPYCMKCGKPVNEDEEYCRDCARSEHVYDEGRAVFVYDEYMSKSMYRFKYNGKREYAVFYGEKMYDRLERKIRSWNVEAIVPVPVHKKRLSKRGYNQAYLLAKELSKRLKIPVCDHLVIRKTATKVQKNLSAASRQNNLKKAFIVSENSVKYSSVLIVDDIYTTGATVDAVAGCLKGAGIGRVYFVSLCIGRGC
ncbi:MAG: ComF family protein [Lachnospiraceae bacterium]|nr:ComF family protein [Lachnospiraceae bacterium]